MSWMSYDWRYYRRCHRHVINYNKIYLSNTPISLFSASLSPFLLYAARNNNINQTVAIHHFYLLVQCYGARSFAILKPSISNESLAVAHFFFYIHFYHIRTCCWYIRCCLLIAFLFISISLFVVVQKRSCATETAFIYKHVHYAATTTYGHCIGTENIF